MPTTNLDRIRSARKQLGFTQESLARLCKLSVKTVYNIERGSHTPTQSTRANILTALRIPVEEHFAIFGPLPRR
jgi:transcriptional regulator with XRE-family HTH domain